MNRRYAALLLSCFFASNVGCQAESTLEEDDEVETSTSALGASIILTDAVLLLDGVSIPVTATATYSANVKFPEVTIEVSGDELSATEWSLVTDGKGGNVVGEIEGYDAKLKERRRATFQGACITEVKLEDLDANNNKKAYQITYTVQKSQFTLVDDPA